jgi:hypothetical protein
MYHRAMISSNGPEIIIDHFFELMAEIWSNTSLGLLSQQGKTPTEHLLGDTIDVSNICQFEWYEWVWWLDATDKCQNKKLGKYFGPSHGAEQSGS